MPSKSSTGKKRSQKRAPKELPADRFINRELSWLEFNERVLDQAADSSLPLLERAKFLAITSSNLDEFMMVRVGSLKMQYHRNSMVCDPSGMTVAEQLQAVASRCKSIVNRQYQVLRETLEPRLADADIHRVDLNSCSDRCSEAADARFQSDVFAVLSPQAIFAERPFPLLQGLGLHVCASLKSDPKASTRLRPQSQDSIASGAPTSADEELGLDFVVIPLGRTLPRMMPMPSDRGHAYVLLEELVKHYIDDFFPGREVQECISFRLTRNADVELREDSAADLMVGMEDVLESRRLSRPVRMEYTAGASDSMLAFLSEKMELRGDDLFAIDGPLDLTYLFTLHGLEGFDALRDEAWLAQGSPNIDPAESMFTTIAAGDLLMIHPYEKFDPVVRLIEEAANDPDVLAIKQVLYRTSRNSPIVAALMRAAEHGKYVSVIVELKARFDEARNIEWAREMEQAGVQVIYGIRGLKTHAKVCIIVRREPQGIVRYMHFGTGNYNEVTANLYGDVSLLTCNEELGIDATSFFNCVTGASQPQQLQHLASAPMTLRSRLIELIESETLRAQSGQRGEIIAKLNALVDTQIIDSLYRASQAGVKILLNIRGVCCLKPGVKGLSDSIKVVSIVDRYLEHARVIMFRHGGDHELYISSADWMPRNLDRRVELLVPVDDEDCRKKLQEMLGTYFKDTTNVWVMQSNGAYKRTEPGDEKFRSQKVLYDRACKTMKAIRQSRLTRFETHEPNRVE
ncbi:polyphosphate kinase 1 [Rubripirellula reticaptiva]|uniref:Polyphosphate kinase n=1 Tax=Rubripirellula reticaptiva TaxID=2528013 RepID=A0A5C6FCG4_9BACT|nr:polyphosphate kinase 1 [Rubripirellula reticaptiva]TWU57329.1 Polyphosphate kinase [Rubripirellula reticaptiva]